MTVLDANISQPLDGGPSFSLKNRIVRAVWGVSWTLLAAWTPPPMHSWRRTVLRFFGAKMGAGARVYGSTRIWYPPHLRMGSKALMGPRVRCYNQDIIHIGNGAIISQDSYLCAGTHDISDPNFQLITKPIEIGEDAWIAADAFIGPGVTVGAGAVLGARGCAMRDLEPWTVYRGNPATPQRTRRLRS